MITLFKFVEILFVFVVILLLGVFFCMFFDQAIFTRRGTIYRVKTRKKIVALTFDDGPSPEWTPQILDELKGANIRATFFMIGHHVKKYPAIARRVAQEGHVIGNHGYAHSVIFYYTPEELEEEIKYTEHIIKEVTGQTTRYYRPPKAWMRQSLKAEIKSLGYETVLWSLNSKDWVTFNHRYMAKYLTMRVRSGDIILFHDSGNVLSTEGGDRSQTVAAIALLARRLRKRGFEFVDIEELIHNSVVEH